MRCSVASTSSGDADFECPVPMSGREVSAVCSLIGCSSRVDGFALQPQRKKWLPATGDFASCFSPRPRVGGCGESASACSRCALFSERIEERDQLVFLICTQTAVVVDHERCFACVAQNRLIARKRFTIVH